MKPSWTLRQLLAAVRGVALMIGVFWVLILFQLVPAFLRGGLAALRAQIERVATTGVAPQYWDLAISRMYEALATTLAAGAVLFLVQRYLGRKLTSQSNIRTG